MAEWSGKLAEYFVSYAGEGVHYVLLIEQLRFANTRSDFLTTVQTLINYGELQEKQCVDKIDQTSIDVLLQFIRIGNIAQVSQFRSALSHHIWIYELEKIRQQEQYLMKLLS